MTPRPARPRWAAVIAATTILLASAMAHGEDPIQPVTLTAAGPDRPIPVGTSFYLAGEVDETVMRVQPILVRKGSRWLFGGEGPTCKALEKTLGPLRVPAGEDALMNLSSGLVTTTESAIWVGTGGEFPNDPAFVPEPWVRKKDVTGPASFKILVPANSSFFVAGGSFCLFVFEKTKTQKSIQQPLRDAVAQSEMALHACDAKAKSGAIDQAGLDACRGAAEHERQNLIAAETAKLTSKSSADAVAKINAVEPTISNLFKMPAMVRAIFNSWLTLDAMGSPKAFGRNGAIPPKLPTRQPFAGMTTISGKEASEALGRALVVLLARRNGLLMNPDAKSGPLSYLTTDKGIKVTHVELHDDQQIFVSGEANDAKKTHKESPALDPKTNTLTLPYGEVTLRDVLEFAHGSIRLDGKYYTARMLFDRINPILAATTAPLSPEDAKFLGGLIASLTALDTELSRLFRASWFAIDPTPAAVPPSAEDVKARTAVLGARAAVMEGTEAAIERDLGIWLRAAVLPCDDPEMKTWHSNAACPNRSSELAWPGFVLDESPVWWLADKLQLLLTARLQWAQPDTLNVSTITYDVGPIARPYEAGAEFTQSTWFFSYVTPIVGVAIPLRTAEPFNLPYVGVQLHLVPNPVDDPMWSNGARDFRRALALELAIGTTSGPFGQDNRFKGWKGLPPLFVGAAFHLIPYTSVVIGGTVLQRQASTVPQESPQIFSTPYVGLNVQANVPDLVLALKGRAGATTATVQK
jgi:hypothetical protein